MFLHLVCQLSAGLFLRSPVELSVPSIIIIHASSECESAHSDLGFSIAPFQILPPIKTGGSKEQIEFLSDFS